MGVGHHLRLRHAPWLWTAWGVGLLALLLFVRSVWPVPRLEHLPGFAEAVQLLEQSQDSSSITVLWPPEYSAALGALPPKLLATTAVPQENPTQRRLVRVMLLGPAGLSPPPELEDATLVRRQRFAEVEVQIFSYAGADRTDFELRQTLDGVAVSLAGPQWNVSCDLRRAEGGWSCPGRPDWNHVAAEELTVDGQRWPCVWAHPVSGHQLIFDLGPRTLWDSLELELALSDAASTTPGGASVLAQLEIDGSPTQRLVRTNGRGIARLSWPTQRGETRRLRLLVTTTDDGRRHLGLNLRLVERHDAVVR